DVAGEAEARDEPGVEGAAVVQADVPVAVRAVRATRPAPAEHHGDHAGQGDELRDDHVEDRHAPMIHPHGCCSGTPAAHRGQRSGSQISLSRVATASRGRPADAATRPGVRPSASNAPIATGRAPACASAARVARTADPAFTTSSTTATRSPARWGTRARGSW